jgi:CMP-N,N'-diacetyllegionaminic acid synthase
LPMKNKLSLCGKPLFQYSIDAAHSSNYIDSLVITTDDIDILTHCDEISVTTIKRPEYLSDDFASSIDVISHVLQLYSGFDYFVLLQPTSPLRTSSDIDACISLVYEHSASSCVSITSSKSSPYSLFTLESPRISRFLPKPISSSRRQDFSPFYYVNGAVYAVDIPSFLLNPGFIFADTLGYTMPQERSVDIDSLFDFHFASSLISY